jgi:hypothetical protein
MKRGLRNGWLTVADVRRFENLPPLASPRDPVSRPEPCMPVDRPVAGVVEQRSAVASTTAPRVEGNHLHVLIPFGVDVARSRRLARTARARLSERRGHARPRRDLNHDESRLLGRYPTTLTVEQRDNASPGRRSCPTARPDKTSAKPSAAAISAPRHGGCSSATTHGTATSASSKRSANCATWPCHQPPPTPCSPSFERDP